MATRNSQARLTAYGRESAIGRLEADPAANEKAWKELPRSPTTRNMGALRPGAVVLLEAVDRRGGPTRRCWSRSAMAAAPPGCWPRPPPGTGRCSCRKEDQRHETFWKQLLYTLVAPAPPRLSLQPERTVYEDGTAVTLEAEVLDESLQARVPSASAHHRRASAPNGAAVPARIEPSGRGDGRYTVAVDAREPGLYRVRLTATAGGKALGEARDASAPRGWRAGAVRLVAASADARTHCQETGGRYWTLDDLAGLPEAIRYSHAGMVEQPHAGPVECAAGVPAAGAAQGRRVAAATALEAAVSRAR